MKRKLMVLCSAAAMLAVLLSTGCRGREEPAKTDGDQEMITSQVMWGKIGNRYRANGVVAVAPETVEKVIIPRTPSSEVAIAVKPGQEIAAGDLLYTDGGRPVLSDVRGRVVGLNETAKEAQIRVLVYDRLYVTAAVPYDCYVQMDYDTEVTVLNGHTSYKGRVKKLGYVYEDGMVELEVAVDDYLMPGIPVKVYVSLPVEEKEMFYVSADALIQEGDKYFINVRRRTGFDEYGFDEYTYTYTEVAVKAIYTTIATTGYERRYAEIESESELKAWEEIISFFDRGVRDLLEDFGS